jgi:hypothetical protein
LAGPAWRELTNKAFFPAVTDIFHVISLFLISKLEYVLVWEVDLYQDGNEWLRASCTK